MISLDGVLEFHRRAIRSQGGASLSLSQKNVHVLVTAAMRFVPAAMTSGFDCSNLARLEGAWQWKNENMKHDQNESQQCEKNENQTTWKE